MADDTLTSTLTDPQAAAQALPVSQPQISQQAPDLPRFQRTFGNTLKSMLVGLGEGGVLGAAFGAVNPAAIERQQQQRQQAIKTQQDFESARAASEAARAVQAQKQADAFDEQTRDLHDQREARLLDQAKTLGLSVVGVVDTNQGMAQNNQNANAALKNIQAQNNGQYPEGIVPFHLADKTILMKATDPTAGLDYYNSVQRAKGERPVSPDEFKVMLPAAKNEALEYFRPKNPQGIMDSSTLSIAQQRLATAQAQAPYPEQSQHVKDLTQEVDLQQLAVRQGNELAKSQAEAAGQAEVAKNAITGPAATAQEVSRQNELAKTAQGKAALAKSAAETAEAGARTNLTNLQAKQFLTDNTPSVFGDTGGTNPATGAAMLPKDANKAWETFNSKTLQPLQTSTEKSFRMAQTAFNEYQASGGHLPTGAQSMLLLSQHLSTTFGNVKGSRVTKDMIAEHLNARGITDKATVAVQRIVNGDQLSPDQWSAFMGLIGQSREFSYEGAIDNARANGIGKTIPAWLPKAPANGTKIDPSTARIYKYAAHGDSAKALQAAQQNGWGFQ